MDIITVKYDYRDGELIEGVTLMDVTGIKILGRNIKQIIKVENRTDRLDGLKGGGIEMLILNYGNSEYGIINMTVEELTACMCERPIQPVCGLQLDGCGLLLDGCNLLLN